MDEIVKEFLVESYENLDLLDRAMVELEKDPSHKASLDHIFRTIHTVKGTCGFLAFGRLEKLTHSGENLLSLVREDVLPLNSTRTSALLSMVDAIRQSLAVIEATGQEPVETYETIIEELVQLTEVESSAVESGEELEDAPEGCETSEAEADAPEPQTTKAEILPDPVIGEIEVSVAPFVVQVVPLVPAIDSEKPAEVRTAPPATSSADGGAAKQSGISDSTVRVDVSLLDKLMNLVGELVLARNQVLQHTSHGVDAAFLATSQRLNLITTELQANVMKTRMQPIDNIWGKLPRVVRDIATACGKEVRVEMEGKETELDKTIIEAIKDPLTHIVRNSVDHGIENPEARRQQGKQPEGCLKMRAYHEGGQVIIEIADDGGGIDGEKVKAKALQRGLITPEFAARMSDHEALHLIFLPGFSTAEKITNLSGRGVGMDVVKTNIERIGGTVDLHSRIGEGTTLKIKIPLTLAIIPALIVTSGGDRFAIPQVGLLELVHIEEEQARKEIEYIHGAPVYRLRGQLLPLVFMNRELKLDDKEGGAKHSGSVNIAILQADGHPFGLVVDSINDTEEIVVKPLGKQLKGITCFAGATIMGDGRVALIIDVLGLAQQANVVTERRSRSGTEATAQGRKALENQQTLLLFEVGNGSRMAIPLSAVARLEEFPLKLIEYSGGQEVLRYRGQILPLVRVRNYVSGAGEADSAVEDSIQVVVYSEQGRSVGLVVGRIDDIVQETINIKRHAPGGGIFGSVVIQDRVTDLLDVKAVISAADPTFYPNADCERTAA